MAPFVNRAATAPHHRLDIPIAPLFLIVAAGNLLVLVTAVAGRLEATLAVAALAPLVVALARRPQRGVLALAALAPFDGLLDLLPHAGTLHVWKELVVVAILLATFVVPADTRAPRRRKLPNWFPAVAALAGLGLVSAVLVGGNQGATGLRIDFFYLLLAWAVWRCPPNVTERDRLVTILMVTGVTTGAIGLVEEVVGQVRLHAIGFPYNTTIRFAGGHILRSFGTFSYQAPFAYFLMVALLVGLSQVLVEPQRPRNRLFAASTPLMLGSLLFTFDRGAWLGLAVGCLYLGVRRHRRILAAVPLALLVPLYLPTSITSSATSTTSLGQRSTGWAANIHQVLLHPLGVGIGATGAAAVKVAAAQANQALPLVAPYQPDNYYFKTVYELGVVGLWLLVLFLAAAAFACDQAASRLQGRDAALADGVCAVVLAAMVASVVATFFEIYPMDLLIWLLLGTVAACDPG